MFKTIILLIGFTVVSSSNTYALNFMEPGEAAEGSPWLLVENIDIYVLLTINFILVGVLFYIRRMMNVFMNMTKPEVEVEETEPEVLKKMNKILTDVVPIEEEHTILMHHEYDGIKELDNNLPPWWVWMFYGTIIFAVIYIFNYHVLGTGDLQIAEYDKSVTKAEKEIEAYRTANAMNVDESNVTLMTEGSDLSKGKSIFTDKCVICHLDKGQGEIGPNLTDDTWIYGYDIAKVFGTIKNGTPNGMPDHKSKLNPIEIQQVASFVISMPEVDGKEPQGEIIEQ